MKSDDKREVGPRPAQPLDGAAVIVGGVPPVHRREHAVGAALHRQVQKRHQLRHVAMGGDEPVIDIARMRGRVAQAGNARDPGEGADQLAQPPFARRPGAAP